MLDERERLIAYFQTHEEERIQVLTRVNEVKKIWKMSIADYIDALKDVDRRGRGKYPLLAGLSAAAIVATLIRPIPCMFLLLLMLCVSAVVHTRDSKRIEPYLNCFVCILRLLRAADQFEKLDNPVIQTYLDRIRAGRKKMKSFRRGAFLVASTNSVQDGLEAIIVSYLRIIFQVDFIKFYSMLKHVEGNESTIEDMYQAMGELDALIAVASFRESLPYYSQPEFAEVNDRGCIFESGETVSSADRRSGCKQHTDAEGSADHRIQCFRKIYIFKNYCDQYHSGSDRTHLYCKGLLWKFYEGSYFYGIAGQSGRWRELLYGRDPFPETDSGRV